MIRSVFKKAGIRNQIKRHMEVVDKAIIYGLTAIGEECLSQARIKGSYKDQTGNLRSSTGYAVLRDGKIVVQSTFERVVPKGDNKTFKKQVLQEFDGSQKGRERIEELLPQYPKGYVLIVVAGKEYAGYVMARGYDVLDSAWLKAEEMLPKELKAIKDEVQNKFRSTR